LKFRLFTTSPGKFIGIYILSLPDTWKMAIIADPHQHVGLLINLPQIRPNKKNSWLASLAFAKKWVGGRFFKIFTNF
jgi:hypothetical protein